MVECGSHGNGCGDDDDGDDFFYYYDYYSGWSDGVDDLFSGGFPI